jgi:hypothetical protein
MKEWVRLRVDRRCGLCDHVQRAGVLMLAYQSATAKHGQRRLLRCIACAGEAPPQDLPAMVSSPRPPLDVTRIGLLALDWSTVPREQVAARAELAATTVRTRALRSEWMPFAEREPGEEG